MDTYSQFLTALRGTTIPFAEIAEKADVSLSWLYAVDSQEIKEPGLVKVSRVLKVIKPHISAAERNRAGGTQ